MEDSGAFVIMNPKVYVPDPQGTIDEIAVQIYDIKLIINKLESCRLTKNNQIHVLNRLRTVLPVGESTFKVLRQMVKDKEPDIKTYRLAVELQGYLKKEGVY